MRGTGFRCDECHVITVRDRYPSDLDHPVSSLPDGWVFVADAPSDPGAKSDHSEFCGWKCVVAYASTQAGGF